MHTRIIIKKCRLSNIKKEICFVKYKNDKFVIRRAKTNSTSLKYKRL